jgi:hypothetical protein
VSLEEFNEILVRDTKHLLLDVLFLNMKFCTSYHSAYPVPESFFRNENLLLMG